MAAPTVSSPVRTAHTTTAPLPTRLTIYLRTFLPWQALRFVVINLKMMRLIWRSH